MFEGKTKAALQLLAKQGRGGVLNLNDIANTDPPYSISARGPEVQASLGTAFVCKQFVA